MVLTVAINGLGVLTNAESTDLGVFNVVTIGAEANEADFYLQGAQCISAKASNKAGELYYDVGADYGLLDFDTAGTEEGQLLFMWIGCTTLGILESIANYGLCIRLYSNTTVWSDWTIAGYDDVRNFRDQKGGFVCFALDPTLTPSRTNGGGCDIGAVDWIGVHIETTDSAKVENLMIDTIAVGFGVQLTGSDTDGWVDMADYCTDYGTRAWGMIQYDDSKTVIYSMAKITLGDTSQSANTSLTDLSRSIKFIRSEYYNSSSAWVPMVPDDYLGLELEDAAATYITTLGDGIIVGSDRGRSGTLFEGLLDVDCYFDLSGLTLAGSVVILYGTVVKNMASSCQLTADSDHDCFSVTFDNCEQVTNNGGISIRNCIFQNHAGTDAALLWESGIDMRYCFFLANTDGVNDPAGIEHTVSESVNYYGIVMSGNDYAIYLSAASGDLTVNADSDCSGLTPNREGGSGSVIVLSSVTVTVHAKTPAGGDLVGCVILLEASSGDDLPSYESVNITSSGTLATVAHTGHGMITGEYIIIRGVENDQYYNGIFQITVNTVDEYEYTIGVTPSASPATGTSITATARIMQENTVALGIAEEPHRYTNDQVVQGWARFHSSPFYKDLILGGTIDGEGVTITAQMVSDA